MGKYQDLTGYEFNGLKGVSRGPNKGNSTRWNVLCHCGKIFLVHKTAWLNKLTHNCPECRIVDLKSGRRRRTHGLKDTPEYKIWRSMKDRCHNKNNYQYNLYGGRGITVCEKWRYSFDDFINYMGPRPNKEYSIDRIDNEKGYEPGNCRWVTMDVQIKNRRRSGPHKGSRYPKKLTLEQVREIRHRCSSGELTPVNASNIYSCSSSNIYQILNNRIWIE